MKQELSDCRILIIEDDFIGRATLMQIFRKNGFVNIEEAENGREGLEKLSKRRPDLVVADIQMPEMDGFEFCRHVRGGGDASLASLPILVQTALTEPAEKAKIFGAGASDYISKPVDPQEIIARARVHLEREMMTRYLRDFNIRISQELETAKSTQRVLIPSADAIKDMALRYSLCIHERLEACSELGGDFWSMKPLSDHELAVFTVDFSGHGVNAALNVFRLHALIHGAHGESHDPGAYLAHLNATLKPLLPAGQFATMFYGVIDTREDKLFYAAAASPPPMVFRKGGYEMLDSSGMLLGAWESASYETREVCFGGGDCLLLYSDALVETQDAAGNMLAAEKAAELFQAEYTGEKPCDIAYKKLLDHFNSRYAPRLSDDLTLVAINRMLG